MKHNQSSIMLQRPTIPPRATSVLTATPHSPQQSVIPKSLCSNPSLRASHRGDALRSHLGAESRCRPAIHTWCHLDIRRFV
ncbi:hypothetical protein CC86DRAFT_140801 [Ophiobolus disseminans]|uniref:Uncharacterized protein n=1 Tax=Ophiobolus disseminans TaxID=1469910 RepID=A0A6A7AFS8_9PLEO|nr:hypothetical protein CC86DRAFT_140801 [Ophiobolus disseminans]